MLLRSITKHVKDQNWFAVALDFFIVVVGILIAFQITSWNESRTTRQHEVKVLRDLAANLRTDKDGYVVSLEGTLNKISAINYLLENASGVAPGSLDDGLEILNMSYQDFIDKSDLLNEKSLVERATQVKTNNSLWTYSVLVSNAQPSRAYSAFISSGELSILRNEAIVRNLQDYSLTVAALEKAQDVTLRPSRNLAIEVGHSFGLSGFGRIDSQALLELVSAKPPLAATIRTQLGWAKGHFILLSGVHIKAGELLSQIEKELNTNTQ